MAKGNTFIGGAAHGTNDPGPGGFHHVIDKTNPKEFAQFLERITQHENRRSRGDQYRQDKKKQIRRRRLRNRLTPPYSSMLGVPPDIRERLPITFTEKWHRTTNQAIPNNTNTTVEFGSTQYELGRTSQPPLYDEATDRFYIPAGLSGIWLVTGVVRFASGATGVREVFLRINADGTNVPYSYRKAAAGIESLPIVLSYRFDEGDFFDIRVFHTQGASLDLTGGKDITQCSLTFLGVA